MRDARASLLFSTARVPNNDLLLVVLIGREEKVDWCEANQIFYFIICFSFFFFHYDQPEGPGKRGKLVRALENHFTTTYVAVCLSV